MKSLAAYTVAASLVVANLAHAQNAENSGAPNPLDAFKGSASSMRDMLNARVNTVHQYGIDVIDGRAMPAQQAACLQSAAELRDFVARTSNEKGVAEIMNGIDDNPCPSERDFADFGLDIFRDGPAKVVAGMQVRIDNVVRYNSDFTAGRETKQEWAVCQGSLSDLQNVVKWATQEPLDKALVRRINAKKLACPVR